MGCCVLAVVVPAAPVLVCEGSAVRLDASSSALLNCSGSAAFQWYDGTSLLAGETVEGEIRCVARDGRVVWLRYRIRPVTDEHGRVARLYGAAQNITRQKQEEESRRASEQRERARAEELETILEAVPAAVWIAEDSECRKITGSRRICSSMVTVTLKFVAVLAVVVDVPLPGVG